MGRLLAGLPLQKATDRTRLRTPSGEDGLDDDLSDHAGFAGPGDEGDDRGACPPSKVALLTSARRSPLDHIGFVAAHRETRAERAVREGAEVGLPRCRRLAS